MKKILFALVMTISIEAVAQQNVGIGTNAPNASAILDITSSNKGVLLPRISLTDTLDNTSIPNAAPHLLVINTNTNLPGGKGLYYNKGTVFPRWERVGQFKLPFDGTVAYGSTAFFVENTGATALSDAIQGYSSNGAAIKGISNTGVGVSAYSVSGYSLEVSGKIKISGIGQAVGAGKVLTSDANGNATWQGAVSFSSNGVQPDGASDFSSGEEKKVAFYTEDYDYGNNYNNSAGAPFSTFIAPVKGIYHFDVKTIWDQDYSTGYSSLSLKATYNASTSLIGKDYIYIVNSFAQHNISKDVQLEAGTHVFATLVQSSGSTLSLVKATPYCYFTGRLVMKL